MLKEASVCRCSGKTTLRFLKDPEENRFSLKRLPFNKFKSFTHKTATKNSLK